jgi:hypothetical protein
MLKALSSLDLSCPKNKLQQECDSASANFYCRCRKFFCSAHTFIRGKCYLIVACLAVPAHNARRLALDLTELTISADPPRLSGRQGRSRIELASKMCIRVIPYAPHNPARQSIFRSPDQRGSQNAPIFARSRSACRRDFLAPSPV